MSYIYISSARGGGISLDVKYMNQNKTTKQSALHRIKIIQGHIKSIQKMIEDDKYCVDIVHQSRAVQKALKNLDLLIIEDHLKHCVVEQIKNNEEKRTTDELLTLFDYKQ